MPCDYSEYPKEWKTVIRPRILERAGHKCERCEVENHRWICRDGRHDAALNAWYYEDGDILAVKALEDWPEGYKAPVRVVLTVAHLDHDTSNNDDSNLQALCQRCHNRLDVEYRRKNRSRTLAEKKALNTPHLPGMGDA